MFGSFSFFCAAEGHWIHPVSPFLRFHYLLCDAARKKKERERKIILSFQFSWRCEKCKCQLITVLETREVLYECTYGPSEKMCLEEGNHHIHSEQNKQKGHFHGRSLLSVCEETLCGSDKTANCEKSTLSSVYFLLIMFVLFSKILNIMGKQF